MKISDFIENQTATIQGVIIHVGNEYRLEQNKLKKEGSLEYFAGQYGIELEKPRKFFNCFLHDGTATAEVRHIPEKYLQEITQDDRIKMTDLHTFFSTETYAMFYFTRNSKIWSVEKLDYFLNKKQCETIKELIKDVLHNKKLLPYLDNIVVYREITGCKIDLKIDCTSI